MITDLLKEDKSRRYTYVKEKKQKCYVSVFEDKQYKLHHSAKNKTSTYKGNCTKFSILTFD